MAEIILFAVTGCVVVSMALQAIGVSVECKLWRDHVRFKRRYSIASPLPFYEFRRWLADGKTS